MQLLLDKLNNIKTKLNKLPNRCDKWTLKNKSKYAFKNIILKSKKIYHVI